MQLTDSEASDGGSKTSTLSITVWNCDLFRGGKGSTRYIKVITNNCIRQGILLYITTQPRLTSLSVTSRCGDHRIFYTCARRILGTNKAVRAKQEKKGDRWDIIAPACHCTSSTSLYITLLTGTYRVKNVPLTLTLQHSTAVHRFALRNKLLIVPIQLSPG